MLRLGRRDLPRWRRRPAARVPRVSSQRGAASTSTTISSACCTGRPATPLRPTDEDRRRGYVVFHRDCMQDVFYNDTPRRASRSRRLRGEAFAGEYEPVTLAVCPAPRPGQGHGRRVRPDRAGRNDPGRPRSTVGFVSYRISRVTMEGTVYTISPRLIMPGAIADVPEGLTRRFWLTVRTPADARPGPLQGDDHGPPRDGRHGPGSAANSASGAGTLDPVDIPAGPFGYRIGIPWYGDDPRAADVQPAV